MPRPFLTAEWRKLIMANYEISPSLLQPYLPAHTEPDSWNGITYISLVGFMFRQTKVRGVMIPFHINFPEVNLRFYVRYRDGGQWKRGVVFIKEIVPRRAITFVANTLFRERYCTLPMKTVLQTGGAFLEAGYEWKFRKHWNRLHVQAAAQPQPLQQESEAAFITEHYWGYSKVSNTLTGEYQVAHPAWDIYPVHRHTIDCHFEGLYGKPFAPLAQQPPRSVFLAEGSAIAVYSKKII